MMNTITKISDLPVSIKYKGERPGTPTPSSETPDEVPNSWSPGIYDPSSRSPVSPESRGSFGEVELELSGDGQRGHIPLEQASRLSRYIRVEIPISTLVTPRSSCSSESLPLGTYVRESTALAALMRAHEALAGSAKKQDFVEFALHDFVIYVDSSSYPNEMRPLHNLATKMAHDTFYFDGTLGIGSLRFRVRRIKFNELPIGNYGPENTAVGTNIWIRSAANLKRQIYYRLQKPALEYARFYEPFRWVANLAKHTVDFGDSMIEKHDPVTIGSFEASFSQWLKKTHGTSQSFSKWYSQRRSQDFRASIVANVEFIYKEMYGVLGPGKTKALQLFREIRSFSQYTLAAPLLPDGVICPTVVTPFVKKCFGHTKLAHMFQLVGRDAEQEISQQSNAAPEQPLLPGIPGPPSVKPSRKGLVDKHAIDLIQPGDVIATHHDDESTGTSWKRDTAASVADDDRWFGLVQKIHTSGKGYRTFDVIWLYRPVDTPCGKMKYPWSNELFLSSHCSCKEGRSARVGEDEVLGTPLIHWFGSPDDCRGEFFVRQTYFVDQRRWVALAESHKKCIHAERSLALSRGDTILAVLSPARAAAEPCEVLDIFHQGSAVLVRLRKLPRRVDVDPAAAASRPNELVYPEDGQHEVVTEVSLLAVTGRCIVRIFSPLEPIPSPYNRNGAANVFFITHKLAVRQNKSEFIPFGDGSQSSIKQGFDPKSPVQKLRGLDLFCGGGNFGRGLEEGGAVEMRWANDLWDRAIHTYMANSPSLEPVHPFLGSIDDLLRNAIEGNFGPSVPRPGEVDFISAGSPCQGFSLLTSDKTTPRQQKNQSLVAAFATAVDFYRPKFGILENVLSIVQTGEKRSEDLLSQLICTIVGLGYQTQLIIGDAWSYGAPQSRSRVFLYFAEPALRLPNPPLPSHSHPSNIRPRGLGRMSNGEEYDRRSFLPTAFKFVSAGEATAGLPDIGDGKPDCCVPFPDHRLSYGVTAKTRHQICQIPTHPFGMSFAKVWDNGKGVMTPAERELFPSQGKSRVKSNSKGWGRIHPRFLFSTIATSCSPTDARVGRQLHWREDRPTTVMEARRAQGFPDEEVLLGTLGQQWKLIGNSVARQMALALGLQLREAWVGSLLDETSQTSQASTAEEQVDVAVWQDSMLLLPENTENGSTTDEDDNERDEWPTDFPQQTVLEPTVVEPVAVSQEKGTKKRRASTDLSRDASPQQISSQASVSGDSSLLDNTTWEATTGVTVFQLPFGDDIEDGLA